MIGNFSMSIKILKEKLVASINLLTLQINEDGFQKKTTIASLSPSFYYNGLRSQDINLLEVYCPVLERIWEMKNFSIIALRFGKPF